MGKIMIPKRNTIIKLSMFKSKTIIFMIKIRKFSRLINKTGYNKLRAMVEYFTTLQKILVMPTLIQT